jgi:predicted esterase
VTPPATPDLGLVHRFVPGDGDGRALLLLHGTGGDEDDLIPLGKALAPGAALLSPRGAVLERGMPRFFRRLAEGVFDLDDLVARTHQLANFVAAASAAYHLTPGKLIALGFSNGANIAASTLLLRPQTLGGAALLRPMVPFEPDTLPDLTGVPVLIASGRSDPMVPHEQSERLAALLAGAGADVTVHWSPGGHGLDQGDLEALNSWFAAQSDPVLRDTAPR